MKLRTPPNVEVFLKAFEGLTKSEQRVFIDRLLRERAYRKDLLDVATLEARRNEPVRPLRTYLEERSRHERG